MLWERLLSLVASNEILHKINKLMLTSCSDGVLIQNCSRKIVKFFMMSMVAYNLWIGSNLPWLATGSELVVPSLGSLVDCIYDLLWQSAFPVLSLQTMCVDFCL